MTTGDLTDTYAGDKAGDAEATIFAAATSGDKAAVDEALRNGEPIDSRAKDAQNQTPLFTAIMANVPALDGSGKMSHVEVINHLLERGADPNAKKANGDTPLHWAAYRGDKETCMQLMAYGADPDAPGEFKNRPLHLACTNHHEEIAAILLTRGASVVARNEYGVTPFGIATNQSVKDLVQSVEKGGEAARTKLRMTMAQQMSIEAEEKRKAAAKAKADEEKKKAHDEEQKKKRADEEEAERQEEVRRLQGEIDTLNKKVEEYAKAEEERLKREEEERLKAEAEAAAKKGKKKKGKK